ncbi:MAG: hypothetical protein SFU83_14950 [Meiothermus sp.]|nr:hypothetical protein [Meiothermus sp.]
MSNTIVSDISAAFQEALRDGFQLSDVLTTLEAGAKSAVRYAFDQLPGADQGQSRRELALDVLKRGWRTLVGAARDLLVAALGAWMGYAFDIVRGAVEGWGDSLIESVVGDWLDALLKWAYSADKYERRMSLLGAGA